MIGDDRFSEAIRTNPKDADAYFKRAMARNNRDLAEAALKDFNRAIALNPRHAEAYDGRGLALAKTGEVVKAQRDFDRAIEIDPKYSSAYRHRADNYKALAKTPEGKRIVDTRAESYRKSFSAAKTAQLKDKGWQPLNATTGNISRYAGMSFLARADYDIAARIEAGYDLDGYGIHIGGGGIGIGGPGVAVKGYPGVGVIADAPLTVYPIQVKRGDVITLVANPAAMAAGMPQKLNADGKPIKTAYGKKGPGKMEVGSVDFYRDADGNGDLDPEVDQYLASDSTMQDGYTAEINTAIMPPGAQNFFAVPNGTEESGMSAEQVASLIEKLQEAADKERALAKQAAAAAAGSGLTADAASEACGCQDDLASLTSDAYSQLQSANPAAAEALKEAGKPIKAVNNLMKAAKTKPGEESKEKAASAAEKAEQAAANIEDAIAKLEQGGAEPQVAQGSPAAAKGEILPNPEIAAAPAPGPGKPGPGKPGADGDDGPDIHNHYHGDGDDDADIHNHYYDDDDVDTTIDRALGYVEDGDYDRAIEGYDRVIVDDPDNVIVRRHRAGAYLARGGYDLAIREYDVLVERPELTVEQRADFYYNRGCAHLAAGNLNPAISDFTTSIEIDEIGRLAYMSYNNRGIAHAKQGNFNEALAQFNKAIEINENDPLAYKNRALAYKKLGKVVEAEKDTARANDLSSL
jgi:tetratricopeptide (TPR) repeat protein